MNLPENSNSKIEGEGRSGRCQKKALQILYKDILCPECTKTYVLVFMFKSCLKIILPAALLCSAEVQAAVNMAVIAPRVGELKTFGDELVNGVRIAVDDLNSEGGINGEKVNLVVVDDQCDDTFAVSTAQMMAVNSSREDKISVVIGPYCTNSFDRVSAIYAKAGIFQIVPTTVARAETQHNHGGLVKMVGSTDRLGEDFFAYYQEHFDGQPVALVYDSRLRRVVEMAVSVQNEFRRRGVPTLLKTYNFANYGEDSQQMARDVNAQGSGVVFVLGSSEDIASFSRELKDENSGVVIFTSRYQANGKYQEMMGDLADGSYFMALPSLKDSPDFTETLVRLRLKGAEPDGLGVYGFSAVKLWADLVNLADSFDYADLTGSLEGNVFKMPWGEVIYHNGNPAKSINYGVYRLQNGEYTQVY